MYTRTLGRSFSTWADQIRSTEEELNLYGAIHRDPQLYITLRILTLGGGYHLNREHPTYGEPLDKFPNLQNISAFGFGGRICPGLNNRISPRILYIFRLRGWHGLHTSPRDQAW